MCGICFILRNEKNRPAEQVTEEVQSDIFHLLSARGPDVCDSKEVLIGNELTGFFMGCVLWLQGHQPQKQPISDEEGNIFLWNGDKYGCNLPEHENCSHFSDTKNIFYAIQKKCEMEFVAYLASIEGPWSFIYYSNTRKKLYFGRDILGRRSLLWTLPETFNSQFILCSVAKRNAGFEEIPAAGIYSIDFENFNTDKFEITLFPFQNIDTERFSNLKYLTVLTNNKLQHPIDTYLCKLLPSLEVTKYLQNCPRTFDFKDFSYIYFALSKEIKEFRLLLSQAVQKRVTACPHKCQNCTNNKELCTHSRFAVMFSGGLDSAVIAAFLADCLPLDEPIDLLNVSFELKKRNAKTRKGLKDRICNEDEASQSFQSPDRESGITCWKQLEALYKLRKWNFVEINVTAEELQKEREQTINHLIAPQASVLDDSIGCALYFCGKGQGLLKESAYTSSARVIFSGLGADEQLGGYSRHRGIFNEKSWQGLLDEVELEMGRIQSRNLGRDDRVLSHHGRTVRFPYLDENLVNYLNSIPIWKKANLYLPRGVGEKIILRVVAAMQGLTSAAVLPKRAIQFGSRIAKLENNREKGADVCRRLQSSLGIR